MSVHRTRTAKYEVRWREGYRQRARTFDRKEDANRYDTEVRRRRQLGETVVRPQDVPTFERFAEEWWDRREASNVARNTLLFDASLLNNYLLPYLGHVSLLELRARRLDAWQAEVMDARGSAYMTQRATALLARILDRAVALEHITGNAARALERPKHRRRKGQTATPDQIETMRHWFLERDRLGDATLISVLAYGGPRPAEALGAQWSDLQKRRLHLHLQNVDGELRPGTKTGEDVERWPELPTPLLADLGQWRMALGRPDGLIFPRPADQVPWRKYDWDNWRRRSFKPAAGSAGLLEWDEERKRWIGGFRPYDLRHTCASLMIAAGRPVTEVAAHLGHGVDVCMRTYAHAIEAMKGKPIRQVDELIRAARGDRDVRTAFGGHAR